MMIMHEIDWMKLQGSLEEVDRISQTFCGQPVHVVRDSWADEQYRFPRSKRKRIVKKWRKLPRNWQYVRHEAAVRPGQALSIDPAHLTLGPRMNPFLDLGINT